MQGTMHLMQWQRHGTVTDEYSLVEYDSCKIPLRECRFMQPKTKFSWQMICNAGKVKHFMATFEYFFVNLVQVWLKAELK